MFDLIVYADWSVDLAKRWAVVAKREAGRWHIADAEPAWTAAKLIEVARAQRVLAGFDFPIGVPSQWAARSGVESFPALLPLLGTGAWRQFFDVADDPSDISTHRPFYPRVSSASAKQAHLLRALEVEAIDQLRRRCERATADRRAACALFWTLGGNQVGKAALAGWRDVIIPCARAGARLWPFDGDLDCASATGLTLAETYPAEAYGHVDVVFGRGMSKRRRMDRSTFADAVEAWAGRRHVVLSPALLTNLRDGFGDGLDGEDKFDALLGLCGMIEVADGRRGPGAPDEAEVRVWEGWILGQANGETAPPSTPRGSVEPTDPPHAASVAQRAFLAVYCLVTRGTELLMLRRIGTGYADGYWSVPSGHVDEGEPLCAGASRELLEKTGLVVAPDRWSLAAMIHRRTRDRVVVDVFLSAVAPEAAVANREPSKHADLGFVPVATRPRPIPPYVDAAIEAATRGGPVSFMEFGWGADGVWEPVPMPR